MTPKPYEPYDSKPLEDYFRRLYPPPNLAMADSLMAIFGFTRKED